MGKSSAKRSMRAQGYGEIKCKDVRKAHAQGDAEIKCKKGQCTHMRARAQGYGEIKCKKVNAHTGVRTGLWGNQVQKGQCAHRRAHRVMGKSSAKRSMCAQARAQGRSSAKRSMRTQARTQGYGEIKCKKVNECTGVRTGLWGNQVQKGGQLIDLLWLRVHFLKRWWGKKSGFYVN